MGAGTPTLMPIMPALKWRLNCARGVAVVGEDADAPLPYSQWRPISSALRPDRQRTDHRQYRAEDLLADASAHVPFVHWSMTLGPTQKPILGDTLRRPSRATDGAFGCLATCRCTRLTRSRVVGRRISGPDVDLAAVAVGSSDPQIEPPCCTGVRSQADRPYRPPRQRTCSRPCTAHRRSRTQSSHRTPRPIGRGRRRA